jgi:hypothetical protein
VLVRAVRDKVRKRRVPLAAVDGTRMESRHVSRYYVKRRSKTGTSTQETTYAKYPKVVLVTDCHSHMVLAAEPGRGPASDLVLFKAALKQAANRARIGTLLADADFDGEWVHEHVRTYGIRTLIPPERGRPSEKPPVVKWRRRMKQRFNKKKYDQLWQTETVNSMIKRRLGSALRARSYWSQCREIMLRVITHNVMIVATIRVFYRAGVAPFYPLPRRPTVHRFLIATPTSKTNARQAAVPGQSHRSASIEAPCTRQWSSSPRPKLGCLAPHAKSVGFQQDQRCDHGAPDQFAAGKWPATEDTGLGLAEANEDHAATAIVGDLSRFDDHRDVLTVRSTRLPTG